MAESSDFSSPWVCNHIPFLALSYCQLSRWLHPNQQPQCKVQPLSFIRAILRVDFPHFSFLVTWRGINNTDEHQNKCGECIRFSLIFTFYVHVTYNIYTYIYNAYTLYAIICLCITYCTARV